MGMAGMLAQLVEQVLPFNESDLTFVATIKQGRTDEEKCTVVQPQNKRGAHTN